MNEKIFVLAAVAAAQIVLFDGTATGASAAGLTKHQIENARYIVPSIGEPPDDHLTLKNGEGKLATTTVGVTQSVGGMIGTPPQTGGAAVIYENTGGSGDFMFVEALVLNGGKVKAVAYKSLGDRSVVNKLSIKDGQIILDMLAHGPHDSAVEPTMHRVVHYKFVKDKLIGPDVE
ncbi:MAG TPA: hypothetical protein V6C81_30240 [Planktothrix sp.]|jgi:hypothetical protein